MNPAYGRCAIKTSKETVFQPTGSFTTATQVPEVKANLIIQGRSGKDVRSGVAYLRKQYNEYGRIIREANIKTELIELRSIDRDPATPTRHDISGARARRASRNASICGLESQQRVKTGKPPTEHMSSALPPCVDGSELARTFFTSQVGRCGRVFGL